MFAVAPSERPFAAPFRRGRLWSKRFVDHLPLRRVSAILHRAIEPLAFERRVCDRRCFERRGFPRVWIRVSADNLRSFAFFERFFSGLLQILRLFESFFASNAEPNRSSLPVEFLSTKSIDMSTIVAHRLLSTVRGRIVARPLAA